MDIPPRLGPGDPGYDPMLDEELGPLGYYADRRGEPLSPRQWGALHRNEDYVRIAEDRLDDGNIWVSTVWLGMNHNFRTGPPLYFETMVFVSSTEEHLAERRRRWAAMRWSPSDFPWEDLERRRWSTEAEARDGHRQVVDSLRLKIELLEEESRP